MWTTGVGPQLLRNLGVATYRCRQRRTTAQLQELPTRKFHEVKECSFSFSLSSESAKAELTDEAVLKNERTMVPQPLTPDQTMIN